MSESLSPHATRDQHEEAWAKIHDLLAAGHWARAREIFDQAVSSAQTDEKGRPMTYWGGMSQSSLAPSATSSAEDVRPRHELIFDIVNLRKALYDISQGKGPFSRDPLTHATDTIESMKCIAQEALDGTYKEGNV